MLALLHRPGQSSPAGQPGLALATVVAIEVRRMAPLVAFLLLPAMERIPSERFEEARLNGAGALRTARTIVLPALRPLLFTVAMSPSTPERRRSGKDGDEFEHCLEMRGRRADAGRMRVGLEMSRGRLIGLLPPLPSSGAPQGCSAAT